MSDPARRRPRIKVGLIVALIAGFALVCCSGGAAAFLLNSLNSSNWLTSFGCGNNEIVDPNSKLPRHDELTTEQMHNAAIIVKVGQQMQVPPRGWVVAVATAMQESWLRNLGFLGPRNDHDSLGLFQQRPSQGWGTPEQLQDPEYASRKFYEKLLQVDNWLTLSLTDAAQAVQVSAYPDAYAKHEPLATLIVNMLTDGAARAVGALTDLRCAAPGEIAASGWTAPVRAEVGSGFRTASRPTHQGVDLIINRGQPIIAAAAGTVIRMRCNAIGPDGSNWGCYRDGSPSVRGCGWYVDILHAGAIVTRYCHMGSQPLVKVGDQVTAGQQIGQIGSTGRSSGPHLHFEVHVNGDTSSNGAVDPVKFMQDVGAPLGVVE
jgi:murein DD-endopeptidase MepM/ murein hydrolase activator NlpD